MFDAAPSAQPIALQQSMEFARALDVLGVSTERVPVGAGLGTALLQSRYLPWLGTFGLISRGPIWAGIPDSDALRACLSACRMPILVNAAAEEARVMRGAGLLQVMTPASVAMLDLTGGDVAMRARMRQKWRNRLVKAERAGIRVQLGPLPDAPDHWLFKAEAAQRRERGYRGLPAELALAFAQATPGSALLVEALLRGQPIAGMIFLRHGAMATYFTGVTTADGREVHAHTRLLAEAASHLARAGCTDLDLGTLDTERAPGLARFKLGSGARAVQLGGTWLFQRHMAGLIRPKHRWLRRGSR